MWLINWIFAKLVVVELVLDDAAGSVARPLSVQKIAIPLVGVALLVWDPLP